MNRLTGRHVPCITAHAGCMDTTPNSRESILAAFASEADIVEVDVRATRDGVVVLSHDDSLRLPTGAWATMIDLSCEDVERFSAATGPTILRLEAFLELAARLGSNKLLNLDIKEISAMPATAAIIRARDMGKTVIFSGLDSKGIQIARQHLSDLSYFFNADELMPLIGTTRKDMEKTCAIASEYGCSGINLEWTRGSESFVSFAKNKGLLVMLWTVDTEVDMQVALQYHPDSVTTNYPNLLSRLIQK